MWVAAWSALKAVRHCKPSTSVRSTRQQHASPCSCVSPARPRVMFPRVAADQAVKGALRLGGALALYTSIRCPLLHATGSDALSCGAAGGVTVMTLTATDPGRIAFLKQYFQAVLGSAVSSSSGGKGAAVRPVPTHLVLASAAMSGAIVFGGSDMLAHRLLGLRW